MQASPNLDRVRIASPCHADWESMTGNDRVRFCQSCSKHVYNFSALTEDQITELIREKEGKVCARFYRRRDGTMLTENCPVGRRRQRKRDVLGLCLGALTVIVAYLGIAVATGKASNTYLEPLSWVERIRYSWREWLGFSQTGPMLGMVVMGEIAPPSPPPAPPQKTTSAK